MAPVEGESEELPTKVQRLLTLPFAAVSCNGAAQADDATPRASVSNVSECASTPLKVPLTSVSVAASSDKRKGGLPKFKKLLASSISSESDQIFVASLHETVSDNSMTGSTQKPIISDAKQSVSDRSTTKTSQKRSMIDSPKAISDKKVAEKCKMLSVSDIPQSAKKQNVERGRSSGKKKSSVNASSSNAAASSDKMHNIKTPSAKPTTPASASQGNQSKKITNASAPIAKAPAVMAPPAKSGAAKAPPPSTDSAATAVPKLSSAKAPMPVATTSTVQLNQPVKRSKDAPLPEFGGEVKLSAISDDAPLAALRSVKLPKGTEMANKSNSLEPAIKAIVEGPRLGLVLCAGPMEAAPSGRCRPRREPLVLVQDAVVGYQWGVAGDPPPIKLVRRGKELEPGEVFQTESEEIRVEYPDSPIAKSHRHKYNWVAHTAGGKFTRDPDKMSPLIKSKGMLGKWTCDVCGKLCCEQLYMFRGFLRVEHLPNDRKPRTLDPFVGYISLKCGRGLLGQLTELAKFKEEIFSLTSCNVSMDDVRSQLEEALKKCNREDRQCLIEELERLAGVGQGTGRKTLEMTAVEALAPAGTLLLHTGEDAFRAVARSLAPRIGARQLAMAAIVQAEKDKIELREGGYLAQVAANLSSGGPLPLVPLRWSLTEVVQCLEILVKAINGGSCKALLRIDLACSWESSGLTQFGPKTAAMKVILGYLQARQALHAFAGGKVGKDAAALISQRLEALVGDSRFPRESRIVEQKAPTLRHIKRTESLGFGWHSSDWAQRLKDLLGADFDFDARPLRLVTGCSGAEAPHFALENLIGYKGVRQLWGSEINENPRRFILRNVRLSHLFEDISVIMQGGGRCARHGGWCEVPQGQVDIFTGGFPCTPYSFCNPKRFKRNCFTEPAAKPFFEMRKFIATRRPRLVILENVRGLLAPNPETNFAPIEFILRGKNPDRQADCYEGTYPGDEWGLEFIQGYGLRWDVLYSCDWGLPQSRPRVYIVMVREDAGGQAACDRIFEILKALMGHLPQGAFSDFMFPDDDPYVQEAHNHWADKMAKKQAAGRAPLSKYTEALFRNRREELGLGPSDRPYTCKRSPSWFPQATQKMVQQLDLIHTIAERQGLDQQYLLADLSQQVSRGTWRDDGNAPTLTTLSILYSFARHRTIIGTECMWLQGFPLERISLESHTETERVFLAGNAMSVPVVGAVLFASLVSLDWGEDRHVSVSKDLPEPIATRADIKELTKPGKNTVLMDFGHMLMDDDNQAAVEVAMAAADDMTSSQTDQTTSEEPWARRAAVLLALARDFNAEPKSKDKDQGQIDREREAQRKAGKLGSGSNNSPDKDESDSEDDGAGDRTSWQSRTSKVDSNSAELQDVVRWLNEATELLGGMDREERNNAASGLQNFVAKALTHLREEPLQQVENLTVESVTRLWKDLGFLEAKAVFGRLLAEELCKQIREGALDSETEVLWLEQAGQLTNSDLAPQRIQVLVALQPCRALLARLLCRLLRVWRREWALVDEELKHISHALGAVAESWKGGLREAWCGLQGMADLAQVTVELAKICEQKNKPVSSAALYQLSRSLQEDVAPARAAALLGLCNPSEIRVFAEELNQASAELMPQFVTLAARLPNVEHLFELAEWPEDALRQVATSVLEAAEALKHAGPQMAEVAKAAATLIANSPLLAVVENSEQPPKTPPDDPDAISAAWPEEIRMALQTVTQHLEDKDTEVAAWTISLNQELKEMHKVMPSDPEDPTGARRHIIQLANHAAVIQRERQELAAKEEAAFTAISANGFSQLLESAEARDLLRTGLVGGPGSLGANLEALGLEPEKAMECSIIAVPAYQNRPGLPADWRECVSRTGLRFFHRESNMNETRWTFPYLEHVPAGTKNMAPVTPPEKKLASLGSGPIIGASVKKWAVVPENSLLQQIATGPSDTTIGQETVAKPAPAPPKVPPPSHLFMNAFGRAQLDTAAPGSPTGTKVPVIPGMFGFSHLLPPPPPPNRAAASASSVPLLPPLDSPALPLVLPNVDMVPGTPPDQQPGNADAQSNEAATENAKNGDTSKAHDGEDDKEWHGKKRERSWSRGQRYRSRSNRERQKPPKKYNKKRNLERNRGSSCSRSRSCGHNRNIAEWSRPKKGQRKQNSRRSVSRSPMARRRSISRRRSVSRRRSISRRRRSASRKRSPCRHRSSSRARSPLRRRSASRRRSYSRNQSRSLRRSRSGKRGPYRHRGRGRSCKLVVNWEHAQNKGKKVIHSPTQAASSQQVEAISSQPNTQTGIITEEAQVSRSSREDTPHSSVAAKAIHAPGSGSVAPGN